MKAYYESEADDEDDAVDDGDECDDIDVNGSYDDPQRLRFRLNVSNLQSDVQNPIGTFMNTGYWKSCRCATTCQNW